MPEGHWCNAAYRSKGVMRYFTSGDNEAMEYLEQKGVSFDLIDLSECSFKTRLLAKMSGIHLTPTIVLDNGTRISGIAQVKKGGF